MKTRIPTMPIVFVDDHDKETGRLMIPELKEPPECIVVGEKIYKKTGYGYPHAKYEEFTTVIVADPGDVLPPEPAKAKSSLPPLPSPAPHGVNQYGEPYAQPMPAETFAPMSDAMADSKPKAEPF